MSTKYIIKKVTTSLPFSDTESTDEFGIYEQFINKDGEVTDESEQPITMASSTLQELQGLIEGTINAMSDIAREASENETSIQSDICKSCLKLKEGVCVGDDIVVCDLYKEII